MRVFLVDDDHSLRRLFEALLSEQGHQVTSAASGEEALKKLVDEPKPDLLLVDSSMPTMSGLEFLRKLKIQHPVVYDSCFIVGFTAFQRGSSVVKEFQDEVDELIEKPKDIDEFLALVDSLPSRLT